MTPASKPSTAEPRGLRTALNAMRNASRQPASPADVAEILATGRGYPSHVRALFGDTSLDTLMRLVIAFDLPTAVLLASYATARAEVAAANPALDALLREGWTATCQV